MVACCDRAVIIFRRNRAAGGFRFWVEMVLRRKYMLVPPAGSVTLNSPVVVDFP
jgi:hypothetical protein